MRCRPGAREKWPGKCGSTSLRDIYTAVSTTLSASSTGSQEALPTRPQIITQEIVFRDPVRQTKHIGDSDSSATDGGKANKVCAHCVMYSEMKVKSSSIPL